MVIRELSPAQCRDIILGKNVARLACARDGQPYIVPILCYYDRESDSIFSVAALGQKIEWMRVNPKVCLEYSDIQDRFHWTTIVVYGRYEEVTESSADDRLRHRARELFEQRDEWWFPGMQKPGSRGPATAVVYRVRIDEITGRRARR